MDFSSLFLYFTIECVEIMNAVRAVPTFVTVHTFCASQDTQASYGGAH